MTPTSLVHTLTKITAAAFVAAALGAAANAQNVTASDNASATNYPGGSWGNGTNGGSGFGAWNLPGNAGTDGFNGSFIGTATGFSNYSALYTSGVAFSIYAGNVNLGAGAFQDAIRPFAAAMSTGQVLSFSVGFSFDNGNKGFDLYSNTDGTGQVFNFNIGTSYSWTGGTANMTTWTGARENGVVINFSFTKTASGFSYSINSSQDSGLTQSGNITAVGLGSMKFYISGAGGGDGGNLYFNNFRILGDPAPPEPPTITGTSYAVAATSNPFTYQIFASPSATSYNATGLPGGLTLNSTTGLISGTPSTTGTSNVTLTATNAGGTSSPFNLTIAIGVGADAAQNYSTWTTNSTQGVGFGNWTLNSGNGTGGAGGQFIGNPGAAGITGMPSSSFALYANPGNSSAFSTAERSLSSPLSVGQSLSFQWGVNFDSGPGGNKGISFSTASGETFVINNAGSSNITVENKTNNSTVDTGFAYGTSAMLWTITQTSNSSVTILATPRATGVGNTTYTSSIPTSGQITSFRFYASNMQAGDEAQPYFNNFLLTSGSTPSAYDTWAQSYGLDVSVTTGPTAGASSADPDSDAFTNQQEFSFGTNPTTPTAGLISTDSTSGNFVVTFNTRPGLTYNVQTTDNLSTTAFSNNSTVTDSITDSSNQDGVPLGYTRRQFTITPSGSRNFYRVTATQ